MKPAIYRLQTLIGVLLLIYAGSLHAQTAVTGAITGYVKDPSGAVLADATVEATNSNTAGDRSDHYERGGAISISQPPARHLLDHRHKGRLQKYIRDEITVEAGTA